MTAFDPGKPDPAQIRDILLCGTASDAADPKHPEQLARIYPGLRDVAARPGIPHPGRHMTARQGITVRYGFTSGKGSGTIWVPLSQVKDPGLTLGSSS
jgi:hypothetical protein